MRTAPPIRPAAAGGAPVVVVVHRPRRPVSSIDPRISARRIEVRRSEGRRRLRRLLWLGGAVLVVAAALGATRTPLLDLDHLEVSGAATLGPAQIREVAASAGLRTGEPLVDLDLAAAERALESLPAIEEARASRQWPDSVRVQIVERTPVATLVVAGGQALVGGDGIVIAVTAEAPPPGLVPVEGPADLAPGDRFEAAEVLTVAAALPPPLRALVGSVASGDGNHSVELRLATGGVVRMGAADQLADKLVAAETVLTQVDSTCLAVLDVRVPSAPTVTRLPGCR